MENIKHFFREEMRTRRTDSCFLTKLNSPLLGRRIVKGQPASPHDLMIYWTKWALKRELEEAWADIQGYKLDVSYSMFISTKYTVLSQNFVFRRQNEGAGDWYRQAMLRKPDEIKPENRIYYDPVSATEPFVCNTCKANIVHAQHKQHCWMKTPHLPKAVLKFRECKGEHNPMALLSARLRTANLDKMDELFEYMKINEIPENTLQKLATKGNPDARKALMRSQAGRDFLNSLPNYRGKGAAGYRSGSKRPFAASSALSQENQNRYNPLSDHLDIQPDFQGKYKPVRMNRADSAASSNRATTSRASEQHPIEDENMDHMSEESGDDTDMSQNTYREMFNKRSRYEMKAGFRGNQSRGGQRYFPTKSGRGSFAYPPSRGGRGGRGGSSYGRGGGGGYASSHA